MWIYLINLMLAVIITGLLKNYLNMWEWTGIITIAAFVVVCFMLWAISFIYHKRFFRQLPSILSLTGFFLKELVMANLKVTYEVLSPKDRMHPAVIIVPLDVSTDLEIMLLANMITLTPGTLSIDVSEDRKSLFVHTLYSGNQPADFRKSIKEGFEQKIIRISNQAV